MRRSACVSVLASCLAACIVHHDEAPPTTAGVALGELAPDLSVQSYEDGKIGVYATPYTTSGKLLRLDAADAFHAVVAGAAPTPLPLDGNHYGATIATGASFPFDVTITLDRAAGQARSTVTLPAAPQIASAPASLAQGEDLVIELAGAPPNGSRVRIRLLDALVTPSGDIAPTCLQLGDTIVDATRVEGTRITLASTTIFALDPAKKDAPARACDVRVGVRFETSGTRDPAFGGGTIAGLVERPAYPSGGVHVSRNDR